MAFNQSALIQSVEQTIDSFDKYVYKTSDPISAVIGVGYFGRSRFKSQPDWVGSIIESECGDGFLILRVLPQDQVTVIYNSAGAANLPVDNCRIGWVDYNDLATQTTPIFIPAGVPTKLTNDALGPQTNRSYLPQGVTDVWDTVTNQFDFTEMKNGDMLDIRLDGVITTTQPNQNFRVDLVAGIGGIQYSVPFASGIVKNAGTVAASRYNGFYIGDDNTRLNPADFYIYSDDDAEIVINGWFCKILIRG